MSYDIQSAVDFLYSIPKFTTKNSLDHTRNLMALLGRPCLDKKVIHVAGSNGKGSVCCFLYNMLLAAGKKAALFTSPHLVVINERFQMNGSQVSDEAFLEAFCRVKQVADALVRNNQNHPTFFEFIFAMGMVIFDAADVEYIILETGLGGRLDATNSFPNPILTAITSISLEHTEYLGDTISQIAGEKAGIMKPHVPVVFDANTQEGAAVVRERAKDLECLCVGITDEMVEICELNKNSIDFFLTTDYDSKTKWRIPFSAPYQVKNAAVAITLMRLLDERESSVSERSVYPDEALQRGLTAAVWPGRMQEVLPDVFFDGAHNVSGISVFLNAAKQLVQEDELPPVLLFSMVKDKDYHTAIQKLATEIAWDAITVTTIPGERGISFDELQGLFRDNADCPVTGTQDYADAFHTALVLRKPGQKLFCTGSLYFIGALMECLTQSIRFENLRKED